MTPQEQIAYLRQWSRWLIQPRSLEMEDTLRAVCDLAEHALLTDAEAEEVRGTIDMGLGGRTILGILRRLLPDG